MKKLVYFVAFLALLPVAWAVYKLQMRPYEQWAMTIKETR